MLEKPYQNIATFQCFLEVTRPGSVVSRADGFGTYSTAVSKKHERLNDILESGF